MKTKAALVTSVLSLLFHQIAALGQGALTPPGAPGPAMRTLDEVYARLDARIPITNSSTGLTISTPGSYYLTTNLIISAGTPIIIATNNVTLDLNGYTIASTGSGVVIGVYINSGLKDLVICNGFLRGGYTNAGNGSFSGNGLYSGIQFISVAPSNVRVSNITVSGCGNMGIYLGGSNSTVVESCTVRTIGGTGIFASTIKGCSAADCGSDAIHGDQVSDSRGESSLNGYGIYANVANNCTGVSVSGAGIYGLMAQNCTGNSTSGYGMNMVNASNCTGSSSNGQGLSASVAMNCYGHSGANGTGLNAVSALNCYGDSVSGTGLAAFIANGCRGSSGSGTGLLATHNVNSF